MNKNINFKAYSSIVEVIKTLDSNAMLVAYLDFVNESFKANESDFYKSEKYVKDINDAFSIDNIETNMIMQENNLDREKVIKFFLRGNNSYNISSIDHLNIVFKQAKRLRPDLISSDFIIKYNNLKKEYTKKIKDFEDDYNTKFESGYFNKE